jgi:putative membrane protein
MNERIRNVSIWALVGVFALFSALKPILADSGLAALIPAISILTPVGFVVLHGSRQLGWARLAYFFAIASIVSWSYESLSIATGFPFGHYHYTDEMGPKIGTVPVLIMPAYYAVCYVAWHLAKLLIDRRDAQADRVQTFTVPLLAAFVMVMWDMGMDPSRATVRQAWIWHEGGSYFGVPFENFVGWLLCVWTIFQIYALVQRVDASPVGVTGTADDRPVHWQQIVALYAALALEFLAFALWPLQGEVVDASGAVWSLTALYETLGLVTLFSMVPISLLGFVKARG